MASEDNEGREEVLEEAEEAGQDEKKGGDRWWIYVVVMVLGLAGVGYLALNGIGRSAHKLAAGDKYGRLAAASEEYGGEDAARRGDAFYDAEESDAGGGVISGALMVRNSKLEEAQRQAAGAGSHTAVVSGGGAVAENASGGQSPAQDTASASGGSSPGPADGQMAAKLKARASMGAGAASARTSGQASAFQGGSGSKVGLASAQNDSDAPSGVKKADKGSVLSALKGAFQASFYGSRLASQDAAKAWSAKAFDAAPDYETAIEYEEKMRTSLDKVNPGSIPSFLREQELSGGDAKSIDVPKVEGFAVDIEASKAATKESKKNKSMAENMASGLMNGLFSGIGSATSGDEENEDDRSVVEISSEDENAWLFEFYGFDYTDMYGSYGAECGCSEAAPCCCLGSDYYSGSGSTDLSGGYSTDFYDTNGVVWV